MADYSIHLHDGDNPPRSTHVQAADDDAARDWGFEWLLSEPLYTNVSVVQGTRLIGKYLRSQAETGLRTARRA